MERFYEEMRSALEAHGGTVEKFIGDAVVAVFGVPTVHEDDGLRAVRAALDMRHRLRAINDELEQRWGVQIGIRTGINTGEVVAGDPEKGESFVVGDAINTAARLEQAAPRDEIFLGAETFRLVRAMVETEPIEPLQLKGKEERVPAHRLIGLRDSPVEAGRLSSALIGRQVELDRLTSALDEAIAKREATLITVVGPADVRVRYDWDPSSCGKRARGAGSSPDAASHSARESPTCPSSRSCARPLGSPKATAPKTFGMNLGDSCPRTRIADAVADRLAGLVSAAGSVPHQEEIFWAVTRFLESQAADRPLVVIFEDIHWAEPTLLDLLDHLHLRSQDVAMMIVAFARPELRELRPHLVRTDRSIALRSLNEDATRALIENNLGGSELPEEVVSRINEASDGNPLFVGEMLQMLLDDGYISSADGAWHLAKPLRKTDIPPSIEALLGARLDRLREQEREIAQRASVAGKVFSRGGVAELSPLRSVL